MSSVLRSISFISCGFSDQGLELGECHLDGVEIGALWRQEQEPRSNVFRDRGCLRATVGGEDVKDEEDQKMIRGIIFPTQDPPLCKVGASWVST